MIPYATATPNLCEQVQRGVNALQEPRLMGAVRCSWIRSGISTLIGADIAGYQLQCNIQILSYVIRVTCLSKVTALSFKRKMYTLYNFYMPLSRLWHTTGAEATVP